MLKIVKFIIDHPLGKQKPTTCLSNFIKWQFKSRLLKGKHQINWIGNSVLVASQGMTGATGNIYVGLHEFCDMEFALHFLREHDTFLDVGANIGSYTVLSSKVVGAKTISFEPDPETAQNLANNISANHIQDLTVVHQVALGAENGEIDFTVGMDTVNRVASDGDKNTRVVPIRKLEEISGVEDAVFLKLDTEGFEKEVLRGARKILKSNRLLAIATELDDAEVEEDLFEFGFKKFFYDPFSRELSTEPVPGLHQSNTIYARDISTVAKRLKTAPKRYWSELEI